MLWNAFIIALREIRRNLMRSFLTVLGIVIGVASVVTMVTLGRGATESIKAQISGLGSNLLVMFPRTPSGQRSSPSGSTLFSEGDVLAIRGQVPGIANLAPASSSGVSTIHRQNSKSVNVTGTTTDYFPIGNWKLVNGRFFDESDVRSAAAVCLMGQTVRRDLFGEENPVGTKIRMGKTSMTVIGLLAPKGQTGGGNDQDDTIIVPLSTLQRRFSGRTSVQNINYMTISGAPDYPTTSIVSDLTALMRERRNLRGSEENTFFIIDTLQIAEAVSSSTRILTTLLGAVAGVSLLVGGIGIMNIMLVSVTERTREIGIRLAIGARAREVLLQFLVEAVTLSCTGGIAGILLAYALCVGLAKVVGVAFTFDPGINSISFAFSAMMGVIFGFMPARRAARLDPIDALRHE